MCDIGLAKARLKAQRKPLGLQRKTMLTVATRTDAGSNQCAVISVTGKVWGWWRCFGDRMEGYASLVQ